MTTCSSTYKEFARICKNCKKKPHKNNQTIVRIYKNSKEILGDLWEFTGFTRIYMNLYDIVRICKWEVERNWKNL